MIVLSGILPVFMIIGLGVFARRMGWIDEVFVAQLNRVIYLLAIPALLVRLIGRSELTESLSGPLVAACMIAIVTVAVATWLGVLWRRTPLERRGVVVQAATRGNLAYVGFPVILATGGETALRLAAVTAAVLIPLMNLIAISALAAGRSQSAIAFLRLLVLNPVVLGVVGGVAWSLSGWQGWIWLNNFLDILGDLALPGALIALGGQLRLDGLRSDLGATAVAAGLKLLLLPAVTLFLLDRFGVDPTATMVGVFLMAAPTSVVSAAIAQGMGADAELAGAVVVASSLASFAVYILWALVL
jgi:predicted permease